LERKSVSGLAEGGVFYLITGRYPIVDVASRDRFLEALGASLVFLIDWNKARKVLRNWVPKTDAVQILEHVADDAERKVTTNILTGGNDLKTAIAISTTIMI
jgi:hypothetical protein